MGAATSIEQTISRRVRAIRLEKGLSQRELGEATGFQERFLSQLENKPRHISTRTLERLARGLGVPIEELVREELRESETKLPKKLAPGVDECLRILKTLRTRIA